jgi:hypothetical protein
MRKILFLLACTLLVGCCAPDTIPDPVIIGEKPARHVVRPYHIEYNGHKYIYFSGYEGGSMVHDPDCCKEESSIW